MYFLCHEMEFLVKHKAKGLFEEFSVIFSVRLR